ncbi:MAG: DNA gyrase inhibitor YacG [Planctomycetes bacterium HGW-Planctomycetes-1]|nr:MAG: DNA gyrase inhibitor YacG [Planctomycetes bacterium HGW-Planctomycetes-1]
MNRRCPVCGKTVPEPSKTGGQAGFFPFCSERCKLVDLNRWFRSEYIISSPVQQRKEDSENDPENMLEQ